MSTDYQQARAALGARLRELRFTCPGGRLTGQQLAQRLGWPGSKVSKLENGKQTATPEDLRAWTDATEQPGVYAELAARLAGFESHIRSWRRALANGFRPLHEGLSAEIDRTSDMWVWEESVIAGLLQTPEYARHVIQRYSELLDGPNDIEGAVRSRVHRQEWLYRPGRKLRCGREPGRSTPSELHQQAQCERALPPGFAQDEAAPAGTDLPRPGHAAHLCSSGALDRLSGLRAVSG